MFEVTISVPQSEEYLLSYIREQTLSAINEMDAVSTDVKECARCYFSVACSDTFRFQLKMLVLDNVAEVVSMGYKNIFMHDCLNVRHGNFFQNTLINTMCVFDRSSDKQFLSKVIDVEKPLFIDGYLNFKLGNLKSKWQDIANLLIENKFVLNDTELIMEFLQYLLESVSCKTQHLSITIEEKDFFMYGTANKVLQKVRTLAVFTNIEEEIALNVLLLKPKSVTVYYGQNKPSKEFCQLMQFFDCKYLQTV